jgi:hypothetical protein
MNSEKTPIVICAYIATLPLQRNYTWAYGLLIRSATIDSWHWGVKCPEHQWVDMEMFALKRALRAISESDQKFLLKAHMRGSHLSTRLAGAAKTNRDIGRGIENNGLKWNRDDWLETATLWELFGDGMREAITTDEIACLNLALQNINREYIKASSPLHSYSPFLESSQPLRLV